ncbi:MAG: DNA replication and repair protein RecF [Candidatus Cloacimonetes bacterium]|nr:DNA replication and repair protein RecF [Candidatus Cloacimonadota bacterium]
MHISTVHLRHFRNYADRRFAFSSEGAVLCGPNGSGKTNLFEAMAYCAFGRSFRTRSDTELVSFGQDGFRVVCEAGWDGIEHTFEAGWTQGESKRIRLDGARVERIGDLYRWLRLIYFSPADIDIVNGAAGVRRRFIDQAVSQYSFAYVESYRRYLHVLRQRNALLKRQFAPREKQVWDGRFCEAAADLVRRRLLYFDTFIEQAGVFYRAISGASEQLDVRYLHSLPRDDEGGLAEQYIRQADRMAERETRYQRTLLGPHLDDMLLLLDGKPARQFASQGQQRSLSIALRLAQARLIESQAGEPPVLVFDDVLAELDAARAARVLELLDHRCQVFVARPDCTRDDGCDLPVINVTAGEDTA